VIPFRPLKQVVWCLNGTNGKILDRPQRQVLYDFAGRRPNLTGFLLDDFFNDIFPNSGPHHVSPEQLRELRQESSSWPIRLAIWTCRPSSGRGSGLPRSVASRSSPSDSEAAAVAR